MIHSDILNSLSNDEKILLLACVNHSCNKEYSYEDLQYFRRNVFKTVLQVYYNVIKKKYKPEYKIMVDKINKAFKLI